MAGKPTAPVTISYTVPEKIAVGENMAVTLEIDILSYAEEGLTLRLVAGDGLDMVPREQEVIYGPKAAHEKIHEAFTVTPTHEGTSYLHVFVTGRFDGKTMMRSGAVAVTVGDRDRQHLLKGPGRETTDSTGQNIIIMPLQEK